MAVNSEKRRETLAPSEWRSRGTSLCPEQAETKTMTEFKTEPIETITVIYYLTRNAQLQHPHLLQVPLSPSQGLFLRDVIKRLDILRGDCFSRLYSWSSKRRYKNGYVWQDLSDDDLIHPSQGQEYILKGSELRFLESSSSFRSCETSSSFSDSKSSSETNNSSTGSNFAVAVKRNNQSWNSMEDLYRSVVYKAKISGEGGTNAATQTGERRRRMAEECGGEGVPNSGVGRMERLTYVDCDGAADLRDRTAGKSHRWKASTVLMQFIKCNF